MRLDFVKGRIENYHDITDILDKKLDDFNDELVKKTAEHACKGDNQGKKLKDIITELDVKYWEDYGKSLK